MDYLSLVVVCSWDFFREVFMTFRALIFGATRGVGLALAELLIQRGDEVFALVRPESETEALSALGVTLIKGDAFSQDDIRAAYEVAAPDLVVSTLGGSLKPDGRRVDKEGNILVIHEAVARNVKRFVLVTSLGCGEMRPYMSERSLNAFGDSLLAKTVAEDVLKQTSIPWTIIRPGGLTNDPATGTGALYQQDDIHGMIARRDVAALIVDVLPNEASIHQALVALDSNRIRGANPPNPTPWG